MKTFFAFTSLWSRLVLAMMLFYPVSIHAADADLSISAASIRFSEEILYAGDDVRLYATVRNYSDVDISAQVFFYIGAELVGKSQYVSVLADGASDDVYIDVTIPIGEFNIRAVVQGQSPKDTNAANDEAVTGTFFGIADEDRDSIADDEDNCVEDDNSDQADSDGDDEGDVCDNDRDGDEVENSIDAFPDDPTKTQNTPSAPVTASQEEIPSTPVTSEQETAPTTSTTTSPLQDQVSSASDTEDDATAANSVQTAILPDAITDVLFGYGKLEISPDAQFTYRQIDWRTYEFFANPTPGDDAITYAWDFGDGATSAQQTITHSFSHPGTYSVTLTAADDAGVVSDAQSFTISFFHLRNPLLQGTLAILFLILFGLIWFLMQLRRQRTRDEV